MKVQDVTQILQQIYLQHQAVYGSNNQYVFDTQNGVISAFEPVKVSVNFVSEGAGYSNLAGSVQLSDLLGMNPSANLIGVFEDTNRNWVWDGVEKGTLTPFFSGEFAPNGAFLDNGNGTIGLYPTSVTLLPGDNATLYLATGYGHNPLIRRDFLFSLPEVGSLRTGILPPEGSYVQVTDIGNGQYQVAWEDLTGGGDRDFDDVVLNLNIQRIPSYQRNTSLEIPVTATENNTFAFQVDDAVIEAWYGETPNGSTGLYFKVNALNDFQDGYTVKVTDKDGNLPPNIGSNPYKTPVLSAGQSDIQYFAPVDKDADGNIIPLSLNVSAPAQNIATIEKRAVIGYGSKNITFGTEASQTFQVPVLDITEKVDIEFGKYERLMPNGNIVVATVPASVSSKAVTSTVSPVNETINITNPGKPEKPNRADFIDPETGKLDRDAYNAARAEYKKDLAAYKTAQKEYKAAVKAAKLEAKGYTKSLKVEEKAIKAVNKALNKLVKGEIKADKYITKAEVTLSKANDYRNQANDLRTEANQRAEALLGTGWTMADLEAKLVKPNRADFIDPETGKLDRDAYNAVRAEYKEARAIAKLFSKADKYDLRATKLETKADLYQQKALDITSKTVDKFKTTLESLINKYTSKADSLRTSGDSLLSNATGLTGADYYKAVGRGLYNVALAEGYAKGAEIATAVLDTYLNLDVSVNADVATSLSTVDISSVNVSI